MKRKDGKNCEILESHPLDGRLNQGPPAYDKSNGMLIGDNNYYNEIRYNSVKLFNYHSRYNTYRVDLLEFLDSENLSDRSHILKKRNYLRTRSIHDIIKSADKNNIIEDQDINYSLLEPIKYQLIDALIIQEILAGTRYILPRLDDIRTYDQGSYQSCTSNCSAFMYWYAEMIESNSYQFDPSRFYIWFNAIYTGETIKPDRYSKTYGNQGTSTTRAVLSTLKSWYGVCRNVTYPYPYPDTGNPLGPVTRSMDIEARKFYSYKVSACEHTVQSIKSCLRVKRRPISMAFDVYYSGFYDGSGNGTGELHLPVTVDENGLNPIPDYNFVYEAKNDKGVMQTYRDIAGSHAVCIVGYDDNHRFRKLAYMKGPNEGITGYKNRYSGRWNGRYGTGFESYKGGFLIRNSWGEWGGYSDGTIDSKVDSKPDDPGNRGYFWLPYVYFNGTGTSVNTPTCGEFLFLDPDNDEKKGKSVSNPPQWSFWDIIIRIYRYMVLGISRPREVITDERQFDSDEYPGTF